MLHHQLLLIEDNHDIANLAALHLRDGGYSVSIARDGLEGLRLASDNGFDLIILDLMLPGLDGLEICRRLRAEQHYTPILMLTARSTELDRVLGLELGADDYLTKPFSIHELLARVKAIFRRLELVQKHVPVDEQASVRIHDMVIDCTRRSVTIADHSIELTQREFDLLHHFATHPGRVYTRNQLLDQVWGYGHEGYEHTVNSHINRLRAKIERDPSDPQYILTVWGVGYKFSDVDGAT